MSVTIAPAPRDARERELVTPVLVLLVGLLGLTLGLVARRGFDAGIGTCMVVLAVWMLREEFA